MSPVPTTCGPRRAGRRARARRLFGTAALVGSSMLLLSGCTSPRNALGTPIGRCFKVLPAARLAVDGRGRFTGVRYVTVADFAKVLHQRHPLLIDTKLAGSKLATAVCVVAYVGDYSAGQVKDGVPAGATGHFALVVVRSNDAKVIATVVLKRAPLRLSKVDSLQS
jgi:hypothetical protein